jgi:threonine synthase
MTNDTIEVSNLMNSLKENKEYKVSNELFDKIKCFKAYYASEEETINTIREVYINNNYLIDPHTAVAKACFDKYPNDLEKLK